MTKMNRSHPKLKKTLRAWKKRQGVRSSWARYEKLHAKRERVIAHEVARGTWELPNCVPGRLLATSKVRAR